MQYVHLRTLPILLILALQACGLCAQSYPHLYFQKFYGRMGDDHATCITASLDQNLIIGGNIEEDDGKGRCTNILIMKVNQDGDVIWEREVGGSGCDEVRDIVVTPDSGIVFTGLTGSFIEHPEKGEEDYRADYFVGKLDKNGNIVWLKTFGGLDVDQAFSIAAGGHDELMVAGVSNSHNFDVQTDKQSANLFAVKLDKDGHKRAGYVYGGDRHDWAYAVTRCRNGDYVYAGFTNSSSIDDGRSRSNGDGWVVRTNSYGRKLWERIFSGKFEDYFTGVIEDNEGKIVLVGNFETEKKGKQFWFMRLTSDGRKLYEKTIGWRQDEYATNIIQADDDSFIMTGFSKYTGLHNEYIKGGEDFWVQKLDFSGNVIWRQTFGGRDDERAQDVVELRPGVFYVLGTKYNDFCKEGTLDKKNDFWLLKIQDEECENIPVDIYLSLKDFTAYSQKGFKLKALAQKGENFLWDFGDGNTSQEKEPQHSYAHPGVYEIKVTVFVNENCAITQKVPELIMVW